MSEDLMQRVTRLEADMENVKEGVALARNELSSKLHEMNGLHKENQTQSKEFVLRREHDKLDDRLRDAERLLADLRARGAANVTAATWVIGVVGMVVGALIGFVLEK